MPDVLVVEDKESLRSMLRRTLEARGLAVEEAGDAYEARRRLQSSRMLVVLTDLKLPAGSAEGGFGVRLVSEVADSWGWEHVRGGKVVWAQFDLGSQ